MNMPVLTAPAHAQYILHLADNALIHGQRVAQWCSHGPVLEEDIAMANIGLDHIGQARMLYQHAASLLGNTTEDKLAYFRDPEQFLNYTLLELPHRTALAPSAHGPMDYAVTITRNFLYASLMNLVWVELQNSSDAQLAAIAAKSSKEVRYHLRHSTDWMLRLGDGTVQSHTRMQAAVDYLLPCGAVAQYGRSAQPDECVSNFARHRNAGIAHGPYLRERCQSGHAFAKACQGGVGQLRRPA